MFTSLDLLVVVSMGIIAATFLSLMLMFLLKNQKAKRVFFYIVVALGVYVSTIGFRIGITGFIEQVVLAVLAALMSVGAFVLERAAGGDGKKLSIARIIAAAALVLGIISALFI